VKKEKWLKFNKNVVYVLLCAWIIFSSLSLNVQAEGFRFESDKDGELIVVLDPGHGGENLGADYNGFVEKEINMIVANAMYEELTKYEDITVYMTRTGDVEKDISLKDRAKFARDVNADYLFCLHFNMSANNNFYGSEVWVQSAGQENRDGYAFAAVQLEEMADMGLFIRGSKTRLNDKGTDYYGILRHCKEYGITAALIEHCHVDNIADSAFIDTKEGLEAFGRADATAVAKYFGLSSKELGVDYSDYEIPVQIDSEKEYLMHDTTKPEVSVLYLENCDYENRKVTLNVKGSDTDTPMLYYSYSLDGGETFSECFPWPGSDIMAGNSPESFSLTIDIEPGTTPIIVTRAYNKYDRYTDSNLLTGFSAFPEIPVPESVEEAVAEESGTQQAEDTVSQMETVGRVEDSGNGKLLLYILAGACVLIVILIEISIFIKPKSNRKRK